MMAPLYIKKLLKVQLPCVFRAKRR